MSEVQTAALMLAGATLGFLLIAFLVWRWRRRGAAPQTPKLPRTPGEPREAKAPRMARRSREPEPEINMAPSRLARISGQAARDRLSGDSQDDDARDDGMAAEEPAPAAPQPAPTQPAPPSAADKAVGDAILKSLVAQVEHEADLVAERGNEAVVVRMALQIPSQGSAKAQSWLGGRPRLPEDMDWPLIDAAPADFLAQIACADLPADLWDGAGPRLGWLAVFIHPENYAVTVHHFHTPGVPKSAPQPPRVPDGWWSPHGGIGHGDLAPMARRAFPEWPVNLVAVRPGDPDPRDGDDDAAPGPDLYRQGFDLADPAHHPFDWPSMTALVDILDMRIAAAWPELSDGPSPLDDQLTATEARLDAIEAGEVDPEEDEADRLTHRARALRDLIAATAEARATNAAARARAQEIIGIVRDSAANGPFSPDDAAAVMDALRAIRWTTVLRKADPDQRPGAELIESKTLSLTVHDPEASLWAHHYHSVHFDHAKHRYPVAPVALPEATRALYEPLWRHLDARTMAGIGHTPFHYVHEFSPVSEVVLLELPTSGLMSWMFGDNNNLVVTIEKADLAIGDFSKLRVQVSN